MRFMNSGSIKKVLGGILLAISMVMVCETSQAQQTPFNPLSYWVFTPYVYNPAMVGSKDFLTLDCNAAWQGKYNADLLSFNTRMSKTKPGYFSSPKLKEFNAIGFGGSLFTDQTQNSTNYGVSAAASYQIPLNTKELSFLSVGAAVKGIYNILDTSATDITSSEKKSIYPDFDAGIYYYGTNLFTGISAVNILGAPGNSDPVERYRIPVVREYFFTLGYKFILNKTYNVVLEPSALVHATDSTFDKISDKIKDNINPILKLYIDKICIGSYFMTDKKYSFFFEYKSPRLHIGACYELPKKTAYYKKAPIVELTFGLNFQVDKSRFSKRSIW
jgi:type IX secretion system PorP/SprF family membrane protein